jgi:uncharacterized membrane protein YphA (DoxX/SURF4 family)
MSSIVFFLAFCRIAIGLTFAISFLGKISDLASFEQTIHRFELLPRQFTRMAAFLFLAGEITVVILAILGNVFLPLAFLLAFLLLLIFSAALASALRRDIRTSCNCFGQSAKPISVYDLWRNAGFMLCALVGGALVSTSEQVASSLNLIEWGFITAIAVAFVTIWIQLSDIVQLFRKI